jgi:hypothetical protein
MTRADRASVTAEAKFRVDWMLHHLAEARSDYDLEEHFEWQEAKARAECNLTEVIINEEALVRGMLYRVDGLRRQQAAWRALRMRAQPAGTLSRARTALPPARARERRTPAQNHTKTAGRRGPPGRPGRPADDDEADPVDDREAA